MTIKLIALWTPPDDQGGFLADYDATHVELARAVPGLTSFEASTMASASPRSAMSSRVGTGRVR